MKKSSAVKSYVSAVSKLTSKENPFEDSTDIESEPSAKSSSGAFLRPRYGLYIAAAVMLAFMSLSVILMTTQIEKDEPLRQVTDLPTEYVSLEQAIETYQKADSRYHKALTEYEEAIVYDVRSKHDAAEANKPQVKAKVDELDRVKQAAKQYITSCNADKGCYLIDVIRYDDEARLYLTIVNKTDTPKKVTHYGTIYDALTDKELCGLGTMSPRTLLPNELTVVVITPTYIPEGKIRICLQTDSGEILSFDFSTDQMINTLEQYNVNTLKKMLDE